MIKNINYLNAVMFTTLYALFSTQAIAVTFNNDFTQTNDNTVDWLPLTNDAVPASNFPGYPCLTAGNATNNTSATSNIPGCNYATPDAAGLGSLRFTPAETSRNSAILSEQTFPTSQGIEVTYTTYIYGGDSGSPANGGADGMTFFMSDGALGAQVGGVNNLGGNGGALGYSCSNGNGVYDGIEGAYLGLGMDSYGNFLNNGDNTSTGIPAQTAALAANPNLSFNSWGGGNYQPNRIGLRGAGNVRWNWLNTNHPLFYPSTLNANQKEAAVKATCRTGTLWDYRNAVVSNITNTALNNANLTITSAGHGFTNGSNVNVAGTITATPNVKNITNTSYAGTTATLTVADATGFANGNPVTIGGNVRTTQGITSFSNYSSSPRSIRVNVASSDGYAVGSSVIISGVTGTSASIVNQTFSITSVSGGYFTIVVSGNPGTLVVTNSQVTTYLTGLTYTVASLNVGAKTFNIALPYTPKSAITSTAGTVTVATPTVPGNYTISNVTANTFDITLQYAAATITNTSGTVQGAGGVVQLATTVKNYAAIPGGFWVLPNNQLIANQAATTRAQAWPITYKLRITPAGLLTYLYSYNGGAYQPVLTNFNFTGFNGPMPANVRFGFSAATGGSTNVHDLSCFVAEPILSNSSATGNVVQGQQVKTSTKIFLASYDGNDWSGSVAAYPLVKNAGVLGVSSVADWDTNCKLTGTACQAMTNNGVTPTVSLQSPSARNLITWNGSAGVPLQWANLTLAQKAILNSTDTAGQDRLNWLRGDRSKEQTATPVAGILRARSGVLGDVINSAPTWVGPPVQNYASPFNDKLYSANNATAPENIALAPTYASFANSNKTRVHIVYTGSNDGMLHGSRAGANDAAGNFVSTNNTGEEVLGFMPATVLANNKVVGLTAPTYGHDYFVDAAPGFGDLFYGNAWHTWMVGGLGAGGAEVYALDITDPTTFSEANASSIIKGSWTPSSITTCVNFTNTTTPTVTTCGASNMGNSYGTPLIRRLHNGKWAVIFGNGLGSSANSAGVFVGLVNPTSGAVSSFYWLDAFENGTTSNPNGISYVTSADSDGDRITDYLYGGDLQGNVWRFDLTSSNPADWRVTDFSNPADVPGTVRTNPSPLFTAKTSASVAQPITSKIISTITFVGGEQRAILGFGTGQATPQTNTSAVTYPSNAQSIYGIWDWNFGKRNAGSTTVAGVVIPAADIALANLNVAPTTQPITRSQLSNTSSLLTVNAAKTTRSLQPNTVCWQGSSACGSANNQYGWLFDLPDTAVNGANTGYEQMVYNPTFSQGQLVLNTTVPPVNISGQCKPTLATGWTMSFNMESGGGTVNDRGQVINVLGMSSISSTGSSQIGLKLNGVGSPFVVRDGSETSIVTQTNLGDPEVKKFNPSGSVTVKRISWEQLR